MLGKSLPFHQLALKCWFYYSSGMMRPTDQEMIVNGNIVCNSPFLRGRVMPCHAETNHMGKHQFPSGAEREEEMEGKNFHHGFSKKE